MDLIKIHQSILILFFKARVYPFYYYNFFLDHFSTEIQVTTSLCNKRRRVLHITIGKKGFQEINFLKLIHYNFSIFLSTLESEKIGEQSGILSNQTPITTDLIYSSYFFSKQVQRRFKCSIWMLYHTYDIYIIYFYSQ